MYESFHWQSIFTELFREQTYFTLCEYFPKVLYSGLPRSLTNCESPQLSRTLPSILVNHSCTISIFPQPACSIFVSEWSIDFKCMSTHLAQRLENRTYWAFTFTFFALLFLKDLFWTRSYQIQINFKKDIIDGNLTGTTLWFSVDLVVCSFEFYGISNFVGNLTPNPF